MRPDPARAIADDVLYEGYILWPYRRSSQRGRRGAPLGSIFPAAHHRADERHRSTLRAEALLEGDVHVRVEATVRFLQVIERAVATRTRGHGLESLRELFAGHDREMAWEEAVEREVRVRGLALGALEPERRLPISIAAGREEQPLREGGEAGVLVRSWSELRGEIQLRAEPVGERVFKLSVEVANTTPIDASAGGPSGPCGFCSTHVLLHAPAGAFVSLSNPPRHLREAARRCRNDGLWPALLGESGERTTLLCAPIVLEDHPRIAAQQLEDPLDEGEIDELLILHLLSLSEEEKAELRASDPRAREILERIDS